LRSTRFDFDFPVPCMLLFDFPVHAATKLAYVWFPCAVHARLRVVMLANCLPPPMHELSQVECARGCG
jgi:hypothetical protein